MKNKTPLQKNASEEENANKKQIGRWRDAEQYFTIEDRPQKPDWIEEQNKKIIEYIWIIFVSMITAIITTLSIMSVMS